jgi:hypothetical protein
MNNETQTNDNMLSKKIASPTVRRHFDKAAEVAMLEKALKAVSRPSTIRF